MQSPRILLIGINGAFNYGCEAIVRGTEAIIRQEYPDAEIIYASRRPEDDRMRLTGSKVQITGKGVLRRYSAKNIFRKLLSFAGIRWYPIMYSLKLLRSIDAVLLIGGDLYTISSSGRFSLSFSKFGDAAERRGIPYILWAASVGPFTDNLGAKKAFTDHLKNISLITARESATVDYLRVLGVCNNVISCADPAYLVTPEIKADHPRQRNGLTIGVNLSPLSVIQAGYSLEDSIYTQADTIQHLIRVLNAHIVLIPHVICDFSDVDDDLRYLRKVKKAIKPEYQSKITLLDSDDGFIGVKKELIKCDLVIAARMHCAINALTAYVPTILVSYSRKAVGMGEYVYNNSDWVVSLYEFLPDNMLKKVSGLIGKIEETRSYLAQRIPRIQNDAFRPAEALKKVLESRKI
jgi:polysaccharide pyruvyl transferase WcaK-like protein